MKHVLSNSPWLSRLPYIALTILVVTAFLALAHCFFTLMDFDEFVEFYTDSLPTALSVIHLQLTTPIVADPPLYHLISHLSMDVLGRNAFAPRLPSILGFLIMQVCTLVYLMRLGKKRAAILAMIFPVLTGGFSEALRGRPYGLILGLCAVSFVSWQAATRKDGWTQSIALVGLGLSLALIINCHYFGVLLSFPIIAGELTRSFNTRAVNWKAWSAIGAALSSTILIVPFARAATIHRVHPFSTLQAGFLKEVYNTYSTFYVAGMGGRSVGIAIILTLFIVIVLASLRAECRVHICLPAHDLVALIVLFIVPFFGIILAYAVSHTFSARYVIGSIFGGSVLLAIILEGSLHRKRELWSIVAFISICALTLSCRTTASNHLAMRNLQQSMNLTPTVKAYLIDHSSEPIYINQSQRYFEDNYYCTAPILKGRFRLLYDPQMELHWTHTDLNSITALYLARVTELQVAPYDQLGAGRGGKAVIEYRSSWEWLSNQLSADHDTVTPVGELLGGELEIVSAPGGH